MRFNAKVRDWELKIDRTLTENAIGLATLLQAGALMRLSHKDDADQKSVDDANEILNEAFQSLQAVRVSNRVSIRDTYKEIAHTRLQIMGREEKE